MREFTPKEIVNELDRYIIGQDDAKRAVAVGLRNRYRRRLLPEEFRDEIKPKNILMIGSTGVGKTEIARRMSKLVNAPFVKVEATKFTEVGYVGRDVESMVRDLVEEAVRIIKNSKIREVEEKGKILAYERILETLVPKKKKKIQNSLEALFGTDDEDEVEDKNEEASIILRRDSIKEQLVKGYLDNEMIEIEIEDKHNPSVEMFSGMGMEEYNFDMGAMLGDILPKKTKNRKVSIKEAKKIFTEEESQKLIDMDEVIEYALKKTEEEGIIFIDEIDKIAGKDGNGPDVSREGVQRDILPIIEGTTVITKYGAVKTEHILFISAGAFHISKVTDLIPELQGRFPVRVELEKLTEENFIEILTKPENALIKQYQLLMKTENIDLHFTDEAIKSIANIAFISNEQLENIGARRLQTVMEKLLEDISFNVPDVDFNEFTIDVDYVNEKFKKEIIQRDISKYIL